MQQRNIVLNIFLTILTTCSAYNVELVQNGPIVKGANITFEATLYDGFGLGTGSFRYEWQDVAVPPTTTTHETSSPKDTYTIAYNQSIYPAGRYIMQVTVSKFYLIMWSEIASSRIEFYINETLNGEMLLQQNNVTRTGLYVSNKDTVTHNITLKETDANFIKKAPTILTYWFVDCVYEGVRKDFIFPYNYTKINEDYVVEALVVVDFRPLPTPVTTTTTLKSTTTVTTTTTTTPTTKAAKKQKRDVHHDDKNSTIMIKVNGTLQPYDGTFPFVCNNTRIAADPDKIYGYFSRRIRAKAPVSNVNVTGNNWLQHGDLLSLNVKCHGSKNLKYCVLYMNGVYNVTGKEDCLDYHSLEKCEFSIQRYFMLSMQHTIVIIIRNEVSKVVTPVAVTVYKVTKQAQLSVIVVPVAFSLAAVVLIVFGVAYYIQNRSRFVVEVADFNFGQSYSDLEYKTFHERLRDSIVNSFFSRTPSPGSSEVPVWPPGRKYGSMTS